MLPVTLEDDLLAVVNDPATTRHAWADRAACLNLTGLPYFPDDGDVPPADALERCAVCPVAPDCLASALRYEAVDGCRNGWWGGCSPAERDVIWEKISALVLEPVELPLADPASVARSLRARRWTVSAIAHELCCSERTVYRYLAGPAA